MNAGNLGSIIQELNSSIEGICSIFSNRSIVEKALVDLCISHFYAMSLQSGDRFLHEDQVDKMNKYFLLPSIYYLACFSSVN